MALWDVEVMVVEVCGRVVVPGLRMRPGIAIEPRTGRPYVATQRLHLALTSPLFLISSSILLSCFLYGLVATFRSLFFTSPPRPGRRSCGTYVAVASSPCPATFALGWSAMTLGS